VLDGKKPALKDVHLRGKPRNRGEKGGKIPEMTLIDSGPAEINAREVPRHREGDLIADKGHKPAIGVRVE
jgi:IS30 family transposase